MTKILMAGLVALLVALVGTGRAAEHKHRDGEAALPPANKRTEGKHKLLETKNGHVARAHINKNGKIHDFSVTHPTKKEKVKKVKSSKRLHAAADRLDIYYAASELETVSNAVEFAWIGWAFFNSDLKHWVVFWFPVAIVDPDITLNDATDMSDI